MYGLRYKNIRIKDQQFFFKMDKMFEKFNVIKLQTMDNHIQPNKFFNLNPLFILEIL